MTSPLVEPYTLEEYDEGRLQGDRLRATVVEMEASWTECARLRRQVADLTTERDVVRAEVERLRGIRENT